jgi:myo-inositol-1(or 4)-monophosphatase
VGDPDVDGTDRPDPAELVAVAERLASDAAALLLDGLDRARIDVGTKSTRTDMVTEMDRASERLIATGIRAARPDDAIVGEEGTADRGTTGVQWLVDPIDGTTNYLYRLPGFAVSIAAQFTDGVRAETVAGVVADPLHRDVFTATVGGGARRNGTPIRVNDHREVATALVATGFSYDAERRGRQADVLRRVLPNVRDIRRSGAAAVDLCWVACGRVDAFYERGLGPWDYAAGALIAHEAGAQVGDLDGGPVSSAFALATAPALFGPLRDMLAGAGAADA